MDGDEIIQLLKQAERCRYLARNISDQRTEGILQQMADDYERQAAGLRAPPLPTKDQASELPSGTVHRRH